MIRPGICKILEAMQALCVSVIFVEHSFHDDPRNTQTSNTTAIDCTLSFPGLCPDFISQLEAWEQGYPCSRPVHIRDSNHTHSLTSHGFQPMTAHPYCGKASLPEMEVLQSERTIF